MQDQTFNRDTLGNSASQIEARLVADRTALSASLNALLDRLSLDRVFSDGLALAKANSGPYLGAIDAAVRANPVALALTAVGIGWLIFGRPDGPQSDPEPLAGTRFEALARWEDEGGPVAEPQSPTEDWTIDADRLLDRAGHMITRINAAVRDRLAPAATLAQSRADVLASLTLDVRRVMGRGLEGMTDSARSTAMSLRERAYDLHLQSKTLGAKAVRDNPALAGAALVAAGAMVGALLPQSRQENALFSEPRDRVLAQARLIMNAEQQRLAQSFSRMADMLATDGTTKSDDLL